jgi:hypothetical protein
MDKKELEGAKRSAAIECKRNRERHRWPVCLLCIDSADAYVVARVVGGGDDGVGGDVVGRAV